MKSLKEIKTQAAFGDYITVADIIGKSRQLVTKVINGHRTDHHGIQKTFSSILEQREKLTKRAASKRLKQAA